jgi:hypothetical protein
MVAVSGSLIGIGAATFLIGLVADPQRTWANLLLVSYYLVGLGLAGVAFVALQYVTAAGWCVAFRRVPEALLVWLAQPSLYPWTAPAADAHGSGSGFKQAWLNWPYFLVCSTLYLTAWIALAWAIRRHSRRQDTDGDLTHIQSNRRLSALFLVVFAVTLWLASYDWLMSLEPEWYSTIFGVYQFAGLFQAGLAAIIVLVVWLKRSGPYRDVITAEHLHDLGKLLFGFSTFWAYIAYCQYLLVWYVINPEETGHFVRRTKGAWLPVLVVSAVLGWGVPFFVLLPRLAKRHGEVLGKVALSVLLGHWADLYLTILPARPHLVPDVLVEGGLVLGATGLAIATLLRALAQAPVLPQNDPSCRRACPRHTPLSVRRHRHTVFRMQGDLGRRAACWARQGDNKTNFPNGGLAMSAAASVFFDGLHLEHASLLERLSQLEAAIESSHGARVVGHLHAIQAHLLTHFRFEEKDGYMKQVLDRAPHLHRRVQSLLAEHGQMACGLELLIAAGSALAGDQVPSDAFRHQVRQLLVIVRAHESAENQLVQEAANRELGTED